MESGDPEQNTPRWLYGQKRKVRAGALAIDKVSTKGFCVRSSNMALQRPLRKKPFRKCIASNIHGGRNWERGKGNSADGQGIYRQLTRL